MKTAGDRLKAARLDAGFRSIAEAARAFKSKGAHPQNWADHEAGRRKIEIKHARLYAAWLKRPLLWIMTGQNEEPATLIPFGGYVGAGEAVFTLGAQELEPIAAPPGAREGDLAFEIRGASMGDFLNGGVIIVRPVEDLSQVLYRKAVVDLRDGRRFFKQVVPGSRPGRHTLLSLTQAEPPIENVEVESAARFKVYIEPE